MRFVAILAWLASALATAADFKPEKLAAIDSAVARVQITPIRPVRLAATARRVAG